MKLTWHYNVHLEVKPQLNHIIAGINKLNYNELVQSILSTSELESSEWITNMEVNEVR